MSYERRADFAEIAGRTSSGTSAARIRPGGWSSASCPPTRRGRPDGEPFDRVVLDMLAPWEYAAAAAVAADAGRPGLLLRRHHHAAGPHREALREQGNFAEPAAWETLQRGWHVDGLAVRPEHRMVGHTGFLITARRLADGVTAAAAPAQAVQGRRTPSGSDDG